MGRGLMAWSNTWAMQGCISYGREHSWGHWYGTSTTTLVQPQVWKRTCRVCHTVETGYFQ